MTPFPSLSRPSNLHSNITQKTDHAFLYDNATIHTKQPDSSLSARNMPKWTSNPRKIWLVEVTAKTPEGKMIYNSDEKCQIHWWIPNLFTLEIITHKPVFSSACLSFFRDKVCMRKLNLGVNVQNLFPLQCQLDKLASAANGEFFSISQTLLLLNLFWKPQQNHLGSQFCLYPSFTVKWTFLNRTGDLQSKYIINIPHQDKR